MLPHSSSCLLTSSILLHHPYTRRLPLLPCLLYLFSIFLSLQFITHSYSLCCVLMHLYSTGSE